jgi:hypothetical protein
VALTSTDFDLIFARARRLVVGTQGDFVAQ